MRTVTIDASGKILGRLAVEIANTLRGKDQPTFRPDRSPEVTVKVTNVGQIKVTGKKLEQKQYHRYSGYPGGLKSTKLVDLLAKFPDRVLMLAVKRMLPKNRQQAVLMKRLIIE